MRSFNSFLKDKAREELMQETSLMDVQCMFDHVDLEVIAPVEASEVENQKQFRFTAKTKKGSTIDMTMGISELLHPTFIHSLRRLYVS